jgi:hypothetical protein
MVRVRLNERGSFSRASPKLEMAWSHAPRRSWMRPMAAMDRASLGRSCRARLKCSRGQLGLLGLGVQLVGPSQSLHGAFQLVPVARPVPVEPHAGPGEGRERLGELRVQRSRFLEILHRGQGVRLVVPPIEVLLTELIGFVGRLTGCGDGRDSRPLLR